MSLKVTICVVLTSLALGLGGCGSATGDSMGGGSAPPASATAASGVSTPAAIATTATSSAPTARAEKTLLPALDLDAPPSPDLLEGELVHEIGEDLTGRRVDEVFRLKVDHPTKKTYLLQFDADPPTHLRTGTRVVVRGKGRGQVDGTEILGLSTGGTSSLQVSSAEIVAAPAVVGVQRTVVMLLNFTDAAVPATAAQINAILFNDSTSVNAYYQENSFGNVSFSGDTVGPYTISYPSSSTDIAGWAAAADQIAAQQGVQLGNYTRKVYVLPTNATGYAGYGTIGGSPSQAWIFYPDYGDVFAHELGHNLGLHHASTPTSEYDDTSCVMGYAGVGLRHMNAPHKIAMGWIPSTSVQPVNQSGDFLIGLAETSSSGTQALQIAKADTGTRYYISYRRPVGFDVTSLQSQYVDRISVHTWDGGTSSQSYLLSALSDSQVYTDAVNGITITQLSHDASSARVSVKMNTAPSALFSATPTSGSAPLTVAFDASGSRDPDGSIISYAWDFGDGTTGSTSVASHTYTGAGSYTAVLTVTDNSGAKGSSAVTISVLDSAVVNAPSTLTATVSGRTVTLRWSDNSSNETGFHVERALKTRSGSFSRVATVGANITTYAHTVASGAYIYRVQAFEQTTGRVSSYSNQVQVRVR